MKLAVFPDATLLVAGGEMVKLAPEALAAVTEYLIVTDCVAEKVYVHGAVIAPVL